jgi:uncharacterized protein with von Willebrand factor type A (vWA) domain
MLLNGSSLPVIQRFLGHESIKTTQVYLDAESEAMSKAVEVAEKRLLDNCVVAPTVINWNDQDVLKRLKQMVKK